MISYLGIDPGLSGAFAVVSGDKIKYKIAMPTITITKAKGDSKRILDQHGISSFLALIPKHTHCSIEEQHPVRKQNITAICTTCRNYGIILGALYAAHLFTTEVTAKTWQDSYSIVSVKKSGGKTTKEQGYDIVKMLYPGEDFRKSDRSHKFHDGMVDATLIATHCKSLFLPSEELGEPAEDKMGVGRTKRRMYQKGQEIEIADYPCEGIH